jgi:hypothetical protein
MEYIKTVAIKVVFAGFTGIALFAPTAFAQADYTPYFGLNPYFPMPAKSSYLVSQLNYFPMISTNTSPSYSSNIEQNTQVNSVNTYNTYANNAYIYTNASANVTSYDVAPSRGGTPRGADAYTYTYPAAPAPLATNPTPTYTYGNVSQTYPHSLPPEIGTGPVVSYPTYQTGTSAAYPSKYTNLPGVLYGNTINGKNNGSYNYGSSYFSGAFPLYSSGTSYVGYAASPTLPVGPTITDGYNYNGAGTTLATTNTTYDWSPFVGTPTSNTTYSPFIGTPDYQTTYSPFTATPDTQMSYSSLTATPDVSYSSFTATNDSYPSDQFMWSDFAASSDWSY